MMISSQAGLMACPSLRTRQQPSGGEWRFLLLEKRFFFLQKRLSSLLWNEANERQTKLAIKAIARWANAVVPIAGILLPLQI
jgi:hypothetical protein